MQTFSSRESSILRASVTDDCYASAYADYLEDCMDSYSILQRALEEVMLNDDVDEELERAPTESVSLHDDNTAGSDNWNPDTDVSDDEYWRLTKAHLRDTLGLTDELFGSYLTLPKGSAVVEDVLKQATIAARHYANSGEQINTITLDSIPLYKRGQSLDLPDVDLGISVSLATVVDTVNSTMHSAWAHVCALRASVEDDSTSRILAFTDNLRTRFASAYDKVSDTVTHLRTILSDETSTTKSRAQSIIDNIGAYKRWMNDEQVEDSIVYSYTGASPIGVVDFSVAGRVAGSTLALAWRGVGMIFEMVGSAISGLWRTAIHKAQNIVFGLAMETQDQNAPASSIANFHIESKFELNSGREYYSTKDVPFTMDDPNYAIYMATINDWLKRHDNVWLKMEMLGGEILFRYVECRVLPLVANDRLVYRVDNFVVQVKPHAIDSDAVVACAKSFGLPTPGAMVRTFSLGAPAGSGWSDFHGVHSCRKTVQFYEPKTSNPVCTPNNISAFLSQLHSYDLELSLGPDLNDMKTFAFGLRYGLSLMCNCLLYGWLEVFNGMVGTDQFLAADVGDALIGNAPFSSVTAMLPDYYQYGFPDINDIFPYIMNVCATSSEFLNGPITNSLCLTIASGHDGPHWSTDADSRFYPPLAFFCPESSYWGTDAPDYYRELYLDITQAVLRGLFSCSMSLIVYQSLSRALLPQNYLFLPYRSDRSAFLPSKVRLRSDDENNEAYTKFITVATGVVIAAFAASVAVPIIRRAKQEKFWKMTEYVGRRDNDIWNGASLSLKERRRYLRYQRKLGLSSTVSSALNSNTTGSLFDRLSTSTDGSVNTDEILLRICPKN